MSEQKNELRQIITDALVSMVSGVTGLVPPSGPGQIPDFIQAPIDRAVERISASQPAGVPAELHARCAEILDWQASGVLSGNALRNYAAGKPYADQHNALQIAESDTAREAFSLIAAAPAVQAEQVQCCCPKIGEDWNRATHGQDCPVHQPAPSQPAAGSAGVEEVEVVGHLLLSGHFDDEHGDIDADFDMKIAERLQSELVTSAGDVDLPLMTVAQHNRIVAQLSAQLVGGDSVSVPVELLERIRDCGDAEIAVFRDDNNGPGEWMCPACEGYSNGTWRDGKLQPFPGIAHADDCWLDQLRTLLASHGRPTAATEEGEV